MRLLKALLVWWVAALTLLVPARAADPPDTSRQILVMLKMPPDHYRAGVAYSGSYGAASTQGARNRIAAKIARRHGFILVDNWPMPMLGVDCFVMRLPDGLSLEAAVQQVSHDADVSWSQPLQLYHAQASAPGGDPLAPAQPATAQWHLNALHRAATGRGVSVAVIDSRIDANHPDLTGQVALAQDFVGSHGTAPEQHGTAIAGVIAAREGYGGIVGIAPRARLMGLRACWQQSAATVCDTLSLAKALQFAIDHHARVINMSLSGPRDLLLGRLVDIGLSRGQRVVAAFDPAAADGGFPASQPGVIAVADTRSVGIPQRVFLAPGHDIPTASPGGGWTLVNGTSYAAAHVSGLLALMNERQPASANALVRGHGGSLDACASLTAATHMCSCDCADARRAATDERR